MNRFLKLVGPLLLVLGGAAWAQPAVPHAAKPPFPQFTLPDRASGGQRAIDLLGPRLPEVAAWYGKSADEFKAMLMQDRTLRLDRRGRLFVVDELDQPLPATPAPAASTGALDGTLAPLEQTFLLHSRPGAKRTIYLNFKGATLTNTAWNGSSGSITAPPFDLDGIPYTLFDRRTAAHPVHLAARGRGLRGLRRQRHHRGGAARPDHAQRLGRHRLRHHGADHQAHGRLQLQLRRRGLCRHLRRHQRLPQTGAGVLRRAGQRQREICRRGDLARGGPQHGPGPRRLFGRRLLPGARQRRHRLGADHGCRLLPVPGAVEQGRVRHAPTTCRTTMP